MREEKYIDRLANLFVATGIMFSKITPHEIQEQVKEYFSSEDKNPGQFLEVMESHKKSFTLFDNMIKLANDIYNLSDEEYDEFVLIWSTLCDMGEDEFTIHYNKMKGEKK